MAGAASMMAAVATKVRLVKFMMLSLVYGPRRFVSAGVLNRGAAYAAQRRNGRTHPVAAPGNMLIRPDECVVGAVKFAKLRPLRREYGKGHADPRCFLGERALGRRLFFAQSEQRKPLAEMIVK
jgi:hypothetical protein